MNLILEKTLLTLLSLILVVSIAVPILFMGFSVTSQSSSTLQGELLVSTLQEDTEYLLANPDELRVHTLFLPETLTISGGGQTIYISWTSATGLETHSISSSLQIIITGSYSKGWNNITGYVENNILYFQFTPVLL
jgi:hypothetical protein